MPQNALFQFAELRLCVSTHAGMPKRVGHRADAGERTPGCRGAWDIVPTPANHSRSAVRRSSGAGTLAVACGVSPLFVASRRSAGEQKSEETLAILPT